MSNPLTPPKADRLTSVDVLRGVIIVLMALDHCRDFFSNVTFDPLDPTLTNPLLFFTRWITHFCAPLFMFLAGVGAFLSLGRGRTPADLSKFLFTRGLWLALLEITWVRSAGWVFNVDYHLVLIGVLWALGWSMVTLSLLIRLPMRVLTWLSIGVILLHNLLDGVQPQVLGPLAVLWRFLHAPGLFYQSGNFRITGGYVVIPWAFVMALGYCFGPIFRYEPARRRSVLVNTGLAFIAAFLLLRGANLYGDPAPWKTGSSALATAFSFLNTNKYPPSLSYLLMTLGPGLLLLGLFEHWKGALSRFFLIFGRVPLFFYLLHLPLIHSLAVLVAFKRYHTAYWLFQNPQNGFPFDPPQGYGYSLAVVYAVWIAVVLILFPLCQWFERYKRRNKAVWLSYL